MDVNEGSGFGRAAEAAVDVDQVEAAVDSSANESEEGGKLEAKFERSYQQLRGNLMGTTSR